MGLINNVRDKLRSFLRIEPPQQSTITIQQNLDYYANALKIAYGIEAIVMSYHSFIISLMYRQQSSGKQAAQREWKFARYIQVCQN